MYSTNRIGMMEVAMFKVKILHFSYIRGILSLVRQKHQFLYRRNKKCEHTDVLFVANLSKLKIFSNEYLFQTCEMKLVSLWFHYLQMCVICNN
jgi:hypothetical protein